MLSVESSYCRVHIYGSSPNRDVRRSVPWSTGDDVFVSAVTLSFGGTIGTGYLIG